MGLKQRIATQFFGLFVLIADFLYVAYLSYYGKLDFKMSPMRLPRCSCWAHSWHGCPCGIPKARNDRMAALKTLYQREQ